MIICHEGVSILVKSIWCPGNFLYLNGQIHTSSFGASWWGEMVPIFSAQSSIERLSMGSRISQSLILIYALSSAYCKKRKRKRNGHGAFFLGQVTPCWLCHIGFSRLLDAIKS
jgi:hypothetical protein